MTAYLSNCMHTETTYLSLKSILHLHAKTLAACATQTIIQLHALTLIACTNQTIIQLHVATLIACSNLIPFIIIHQSQTSNPSQCRKNCMRTQNDCIQSCANHAVNLFFRQVTESINILNIIVTACSAGRIIVATGHHIVQIVFLADATVDAIAHITACIHSIACMQWQTRAFPSANVDADWILAAALWCLAAGDSGTGCSWRSRGRGGVCM